MATFQEHLIAIDSISQACIDQWNKHYLTDCKMPKLINYSYTYRDTTIVDDKDLSDNEKKYLRQAIENKIIHPWSAKYFPLDELATELNLTIPKFTIEKDAPRKDVPYDSFESDLIKHLDF